jgi:hypothetical protein
MTTEKSTTKGFKPSPVAYKKTTVRSDYMKYPANALCVNREGEKRNWRVLFPTAAVAQASDGTVYITEPGITSFSVLRPQ